jgi:hypothetical protein
MQWFSLAAELEPIETIPALDRSPISPNDEALSPANRKIAKWKLSRISLSVNAPKETLACQ